MIRSDIKYVEVRKVAWDELWHGLWISSDGQFCWDRVTEKEAVRIGRNLHHGGRMAKAVRKAAAS